MAPAVRRLRLLPDAQREVDEAAGWYEARSPGLGLEFLRAFDVACNTIRRHPQGLVSYIVAHGAPSLSASHTRCSSRSRQPRSSFRRSCTGAVIQDDGVAEPSPSVRYI